MQTAIKLKLKLISLTCHISEENDADEVFLKYDDQKIWPPNKKFQKVKAGKFPISVALNNLDRNTVVHLELWEHDRFSPNDQLGTFALVINEIGGPYMTDLALKESSFARYTLEWESY